MLTSRAREDSSNLVRCRPTRASLWGSQRGRRSGGSSLVREAVCVQAAHRIWIWPRRAGRAAWNNQVRALPKHQAAAQSVTIFKSEPEARVSVQQCTQDTCYYCRLVVAVPVRSLPGGRLAGLKFAVLTAALAASLASTVWCAGCQNALGAIS